MFCKCYLFYVIFDWEKYSLITPDKMPLCIFTKSGRVCFPTVHCSPVAIIHGQVHLEKVQNSVGIFCQIMSTYNCEGSPKNDTN